MTNDFAENPPLVQLTRGEHVESQHRGAWVLVDTQGNVIDGAGRVEDAFFARSSLKSMQVLPLLETGAAERFEVSDAELALCCASHNAEDAHTLPVRSFLERVGLSVEHLQCGPQPPGEPTVRARLREEGEKPGSVHNNCSGKHAGFLALAQHLSVEPDKYLDPESESQVLVRRAVSDMTGLEPSDLYTAIDGCSAPTFRLPLRALATGIARVANPDGLAPERRAACERICDAVAAHPGLIAGEHKRLCTQIARVTEGRVFPKIGGEAIYVLGMRGADRGIAVKMDDGDLRGLHPLVIDLLARFDFLTRAEQEALDSWRERELRNWAGIPIGETRVIA